MSFLSLAGAVKTLVFSWKLARMDIFLTSRVQKSYFRCAACTGRSARREQLRIAALLSHEPIRSSTSKNVVVAEPARVLELATEELC